MKLTERQIEKMSEHRLPAYMHGAIIRYYEKGIKPGHFLTAVINNDLKKACRHADDINRHCLFSYVMWFYNEAPGGSWGHPNATSEWCKQFRHTA
jgi:hypothetical protein